MNFRISEVGPVRAVGRRMMRVDAGEVQITGTSFVFGQDVAVMRVDQEVVDTILVDSLPRWWKVEAPDGFRYRLRFGYPGVVATTMEGAKEGQLSPPPFRRFNVGCSLPLGVSAGLAGGGNGAFNVDDVYYRANGLVGLPGAFRAEASKLGSVQGTGNSIQSLAAASGPCYVLVRYSPARGTTVGAANSQFQTPIYITFTLNAPAFPIPGASQAVKLGDLAAFSHTGGTPFTVAFTVNENVGSVGYWMPSAERATDDGATPYCRLDISVWGLLYPKLIPSGGYAAGPASGVRAGVMGATGSPGATAAGTSVALASE